MLENPSQCIPVPLCIDFVGSMLNIRGRLPQYGHTLSQVEDKVISMHAE